MRRVTLPRNAQVAPGSNPALSVAAGLGAGSRPWGQAARLRNVKVMIKLVSQTGGAAALPKPRSMRNRGAARRGCSRRQSPLNSRHERRAGKFQSWWMERR
jgi:hypothetical protein